MNRERVATIHAPTAKKKRMRPGKTNSSRKHKNPIMNHITAAVKKLSIKVVFDDATIVKISNVMLLAYNSIARQLASGNDGLDALYCLKTQFSPYFARHYEKVLLSIVVFISL
jgi:hypothetical protein